MWKFRKGRKLSIFGGALSEGNYYTLIDEELFLARSLSGDSPRMTKSGVPIERQEKRHQTKPELAFEIIKRQVELGVKFDYIAADAIYENDIQFFKKLMI